MSDHSSLTAAAALGPQPRPPGRHVPPPEAFLEFRKEEVEQSIPDRFEQQVRRYPGRIAIKTVSHELTYEALNRAVNRVAHAILARRGEGQEPVALLFEQGAAVITAMLGVLKAEKFYVPLDPAFPSARNASMLEDSQAALLLTDGKSLSLANELSQNRCEVMNIDALDPGLPAEDVGLSISPDSLAYILYTSGSTGQPKGVMASHRNVLHAARDHTNSLCISATDRHTLLHSCSFSAAVRNIFEPLINGAALCPLDVQREGVGSLAQWLIQEEITIYRSVISTFRQFVHTLTGEERFPSLRVVYLGGEPVYRRDVERFWRHFSPDCHLFTHLALTETGPIRRYFIGHQAPILDNLVPVGYAVEDKEVLLLDEEGRAVGPNAVGEIAVKSRYLSPGYWRRPDLTQAAFRPDPGGGGMLPAHGAGLPDERIYRTGDLGRMLPDGCLIHLGRKDSLVKVRGYQVELAEVERALCDLGTVKEAVVVAREDEPGEKRLVAYLVPAQQPAATVSALRRALAETLPAYMIPAAFVLLEALPYTPSGKVDRRSLSAPDNARPELDRPLVLPCTPVEAVLVDIWKQVLGLQQVGIHDNFFELGGHSLRATQVVSRMQQVFRVELPLRCLFEAPTVAGLAERLIEREAVPGQATEVARLWQQVGAMGADEVEALLQERRASATCQRDSR